ncbi:MAG: hypothetical protein VYA84_19805, partial [Planctomycetota bacterium]|nr:hypothetical protein [Planctomycetota bacterium]
MSGAWLSGAWLSGAWLSGAWLSGAWLSGVSPVLIKIDCEKRGCGGQALPDAALQSSNRGLCSVGFAAV